MANINTSSLFLVTFLVGIVLCSCTRDFKLEDPKQGKIWCVLKEAQVPKEKMQGFLDYTCSQHGVDCAPINPGGACFEPNTLQNHTNYALDLLFRIKHFCNIEIGVPTTHNPSSPTCPYP